MRKKEDQQALSGLPVMRGLRPPKMTELKSEHGPMWY